MALVPTIIRACSITSNIWAMPLCTSPTSQPLAGTSCWPSDSSQVAEAFSPILCSTLVTNTPLRSPISPVSKSNKNFGTKNSDRPLVPGPAPSGRASTRWKMFSTRSPESPEVRGPVVLLDGLGAARADVGARVGLGQHHRGAPAALCGEHSPLLLLLGAEVVEDVRESGAAAVHPHRGVGTKDVLLQSPQQRLGHRHAAALFFEADPVPAAVVNGADGLLERLRQRHRVGLGIEDGRVAVALDE